VQSALYIRNDLGFTQNDQITKSTKRCNYALQQQESIKTMVKYYLYTDFNDLSINSLLLAAEVDRLVRFMGLFKMYYAKCKE
jgi:hypothetical protein